MISLTRRKLLDLALALLLLAGLASLFLPSELHEVLGIVFVLLAACHLVWNRAFLRGFGRGRYPLRRVLQSVAVLAFFIDAAMLLVSGIALSRFLFPQAAFGADVNWRSLHLGAAAVGAFLLALHGGLEIGRYVRGWPVRIALTFVTVLAISGVFGLPYLDRWHHIVHVDRSAAVSGPRLAATGRVAVVYFSRVGNTPFPDTVDAVSGASLSWNDEMLHGSKRNAQALVGNAELLADMAADAAGTMPIFLKTEAAYPASYDETTAVAKKEFDDPQFPALAPLAQEEAATLREADAVVLVYPLWWGTLPRSVEGFLRTHDFAGKKLLPIVTHGGSGVGKSLDILRDAAPAADLQAPLDVYSSDIPTARATIATYLAQALT